MSKLSRDKGAAYERGLAQRWREKGIFPGAKRGLGQCRDGSDVPDVDGTPLWVEAKDRVKHSSPIVYLKQAEEAAKKRGDPRPCIAVAHYPKTGQDDAVVMMRLSVFEALLPLPPTQEPLQLCLPF